MPIEESHLSVGKAFRFGSKKCHVRGFVDDQVCYRYWLKHKRRWHYECEPVWLVCQFWEKLKQERINA